MDNQINIRIKNHIYQLETVVQRFDDFSRQIHLPLKVKNSVDLVLDEVISNIITYGADEHKEHNIDILISLEDGIIKLRIEDDTKKFNPLSIEDADTKSSIDTRKIGGLGLHLVRKMMDEVRYEYKGNKNCLMLKKYIKGKRTMEIIEKKQNDIKIIALIGRLDTLSSKSLEDKLLPLVGHEEKKVIIDFSQLDFISSSGLRVLLTAGKQMKKEMGKLVLCALKDHVKEVFDVAGFTMLFRIQATLEESTKELA